jgi:imidazolonepropionase
MSTLITNIGELITNVGEPDAGGLSAGGLSAGGLSAGGLSAGGLSAGGLSAGGLSAGGLSAGGLTLRGRDAGRLTAGGADAGERDAGVLAGGPAAIVMDGGLVAWVGAAARAPAADNRVDAQGRAVLPGFVDSHAHLVFAGERGAEFAARMAGQPYSAGGIRSTVAATRAASDTELAANLRRLAAEMLAQGITTFECKSGYGLTVADEARSVAIAAQVTPEVTYLGAHVVAPEFDADPAGYVDLACGPMLDACAPSSKWVDVFCEEGAFGADECLAVLAAGQAAGLAPRVHANQLGYGPGIKVAVEVGAASADHCTFVSDADLDALASSRTVATLLPLAEFSTRQPYPDARRLLDAGVIVAIATDCNPGSSFSSSMPLGVALAVRDLHLTTREAVWAATAGGAMALRRDDIGHLGVGARADVVMLDAPSHAYLAYRPGVPQIAAVWQAGRRVVPA